MAFRALSSVLVLVATALHASRLVQATNRSVVWGGCDPSVVQDSALSCGFLEVPLDYHDPPVGKGRLALAKVNATADPGARLGTLLFNPGGPDISGIQSLSESSALLLELSGGLYDIVSWDIRGTGSLSIPGDIFCFHTAEEQNAFFAGTLEDSGIEYTGNFTDPADIRALLAQAPRMQAKYEELGRKCMEHEGGKFLKYVGSAATARDMITIVDTIVGEGSLVNYVGISYGTIIGSWFINMFPERVGRVVLDGILDPQFYATQDLSLHWSHELVDADTAYKAFVTGCALAGPEGCAMATAAGETPEEVDASVQKLLKAAHDATRRNASVPATSGQIRNMLYEEVTSPDDWSNFANEVYPGIAQAVDEESRQIKNITRKANLKRSNRRRQDQGGENTPFSTEAIMCGDSVDAHHPSMTAVFKNLISASRNVSHMFGAQFPEPAYICTFWPTRAVERYQGPFNKSLANPILVLSNTIDPSTPLVGAQNVVTMLGDKARLVRQNSVGHTTNPEPSACLAGVIFAYVANGTLPEDNDTVCEVDADFEVFKGVNMQMILEALQSGEL